MESGRPGHRPPQDQGRGVSGGAWAAACEGDGAMCGPSGCWRFRFSRRALLIFLIACFALCRPLRGGDTGRQFSPAELQKLVALADAMVEAADAQDRELQAS